MQFTDDEKVYFSLFITQAMQSQNQDFIVKVFTQLIGGDPSAKQMIIVQLNGFIDSLVLGNQSELSQLDIRKTNQEKDLKTANLVLSGLKDKLSQL